MLEREKQIESFVQMLYYASDCIRFAEETKKLPDCNTCGKKNGECEFAPRIGSRTRINCPLWEPERK